MECHYSILNVDSNATESDIKKAYKKAALKWHPDKNVGNEEEANNKIVQVMKAYETLIDQHKRSFYDRNKEEILRNVNRKEEYYGPVKELLESFENGTFNISHTGFNDSKSGFYVVYRKFFEKIVDADSQQRNKSNKNEPEIPSFGASKSDFQAVDAFYKYWCNYCTSLSFAWEDKFDVLQANNRRERKYMLNANTDTRKKAKKKFNQQIRAMVEGLQAKDPRWAAHIKRLKEEQEEQAKIKEEKKKEKLNKREEWKTKIAEENKDEIFNEAYEKCIENLENELLINDIQEQDAFYCAVCEKSCKNQRSLRNHELSKRHKEKLEELKAYMEEEDQSLFE